MNASAAFLWLYVPCPDRKTALVIARSLLEEKRIACANITQPVTSIYEWEGKIEEQSEVILTAKTKASLFDGVRARVEELHPYSCPCIVGLPITAGNDAYLRWISQVTLER